jgi:predicted nucleic acid-binding protein
MPDSTTWVTDTSVYTHLSRAGHLQVLERLAPGGVVVVPDDVNTEIEAGRALYVGIADPTSTSWVQVAVLTETKWQRNSWSRPRWAGDPPSTWANVR